MVTHLALGPGLLELDRIDALLVQLRIQHDLTLLSIDQDFVPAAKHVRLRFWTPESAKSLMKALPILIPAQMSLLLPALGSATSAPVFKARQSRNQALVLRCTAVALCSLISAGIMFVFLAYECLYAIPPALASLSVCIGRQGRQR